MELANVCALGSIFSIEKLLELDKWNPLTIDAGSTK